LEEEKEEDYSKQSISKFDSKNFIFSIVDQSTEDFNLTNSNNGKLFMAWKETVFIPRDFAFISKSIQSFFNFGPTEFNEPFRATLKGLKEPENDQDDQFLLI
jgi:hypothetical protein